MGEDGGEGRDAAQQAEEGCPQCRPRSVPPLLDVRYVEDAGRRPLGLTEHLIRGKVKVHILRLSGTDRLL